MCMRKVPKMVPKTPTKMAKKWQKSVKKCRGEAGSPGSPGQGRGEFFLARGIMLPGFPALGPGGDIGCQNTRLERFAPIPLSRRR